MKEISKCMISIIIAFIFISSGIVLIVSRPDVDNNKADILRGAAYPALKAVDIWTIPDIPIGGNQVTVYYKIASTSRTSITTPFMTGLWLAGNLKDYHQLDSLVGFAEYTFSYVCTLPAASYQWTMHVDYTNVINESPAYDEGGLYCDNILTKEITWQAPKPDLVAVDVRTDPVPPVGGQPTTIWCRIMNNGPVTAYPTAPATTFTYYLDIDANGIIDKMGELSYLASQAYFGFSLTTTLSIGSHLIAIGVDGVNTVVESDETNNILIETIVWQDPALLDSDNDGLTDAEEVLYGTNPQNAYSDSDTINDGDEVKKCYTNPLKADTDNDGYNDNIDYDPLQNLYIYVKILEIWEIDNVDSNTLIFDNPADFYWKVTIGSKTSSSSQTGSQDRYHIYPNWVFSADVPDNVATCSIKIELWDDDLLKDDICDISVDAGGGDPKKPDGNNVELTYDFHAGDWSGDDNRGDMSGYGHVSGHDDGSWSTDENDCEMWFTIYQKGPQNSDTDNDGLTYTEEVYKYFTSPKVDNSYTDNDEDGMPLSWEDANGLNDNDGADRWLDPDSDLLGNIHEYIWRDFGCMIDYPDVLVEIDYYQDAVTNYRPDQSVLDYAIHYYTSNKPPQNYVGTHLVLRIDDAVPVAWAGSEVDSGEYDAIQQNFMDYFPDFQNDISGWHYCIMWFACADWSIWGVSYHEISDMLIAHGLIDATLPWEANSYLTVTLMHELGHTLHIIRWDAGGDDELYCGDWSCIMAMPLDPYQIVDIHYCGPCWSQLIF